ncbi:tripartite tricarboxylate transporter substrate binding protein [Bradyrhizobium sp. dw_78]|uniref:Bug family tripartite tricarboxylate transporter substrate binding protein n=1 Tax=Bradyrhizobium sp. dw_78 TaxID=2719793 RepID=UPI001BD4569E|nr:tripartite tricarboxylate transporter substrate binding protein [Bradyrhizobium sp. dw_78]
MCRFSPRALVVASFFSIAAVVLAGLSPRPAMAYPDRPIHLLVPYPAGGPNDVIARLIANKLDDKFGQQVVVENRPGGSGNTAVIAAARAAPDGYTLVLPAMTYAVNPSLFSDVGYAFDQLVPVSIVTQGPLVLVAHPSLGVKSVQELIALAKAQPGKINYGSGGVGSSPHLAAELFKQAAGIDLRHIPYKGTNDLIADLLTGRVPVVFLSPLIARQHVADGEVVALGITSAQRSPTWPQTPTIAEAGVPGYEMQAWYTVLAPRGTPKDVVDKLSEAIAEAVKSPDVSSKLETLGNVPYGSTAAEAQAYIDAESKRWHEIIRAAGIVPE